MTTSVLNNFGSIEKENQVNSYNLGRPVAPNSLDLDNSSIGFLQFLQQELERRCQKNPRYSLRSFAKYLEIDPSALSKILNGKRPLGKRLIRRFAFKLALTQEETLKFLARFEQERMLYSNEKFEGKKSLVDNFQARLQKLVENCSSELNSSSISQTNVEGNQLREFGSLVLEAIKLGIIKDHKILQGTSDNLDEMGFVLYLQKEARAAIN